MQIGSAIRLHDLNVDGIRCKNFLDWLKATVRVEAISAGTPSRA